jgi:hypothetical protein
VAPLAAIQDHQLTHNFALYVPGLLAAGDTPALLADAAPTALRVQAGAADPLFPVASVRELGRTVAAAYADAGHPDRFSLSVFEGGHEFPPAQRRAATTFLETHL